MFKSYEYIKTEFKDEMQTIPYRWHLKIIDSNFWCVEIIEKIGDIDPGVSLAIYNTYKKRGLNVAENIALFCIAYHQKNDYPIEDIQRILDTYWPIYINYWEELKKQRDLYIERYMLLV